MATIQKIEAKGFKSFANKVVFEFGPHFNCILGPNGSGKSNVTDCMLFVLGKTSAKGMRAEKSANLIFNGGKKGTPAKEAEVSIYFDNSNKEFPLEKDVVKITRIVRKNGHSIYKVNDEVTTRQQVVELLARAKINPDGYNLILQGEIIKFMSMRPEERREIIEDISGIGIFEEKKEKALNELNKVQDKLNEVEIILAERNKTLNELKKDRDIALKFKDLEKNIQRDKATRLHLMIKNKVNEKIEIEKKLEQLKKDIERFQKEIDSKKGLISEKRAEIKKIEAFLKEKGDAKQREFADKVDALKTEIIKLNSRKDVLEKVLKDIVERKSNLVKNITETDKEISLLIKSRDNLLKDNKINEQKLDEINRKIDLKEKELGLGDASSITEKLDEIENQIDSVRKEKDELVFKKQDLVREKDKVLYDLELLDERIVKADKAMSENKAQLKQLKEARAEFKSVAKRLSKALNENSVYSLQLGEARSRYLDVSNELAKLRARKITMTERVAGDQAIQKILKSGINGVYGTVASLGEVSSKYALALEVAAGNRIKSVVVSTDSVAVKCIELLKKSKTGVVTFLPLNKLKERKIDAGVERLLNQNGVEGMAINLVKYDRKFSNVFKYVFGGTLVVKDLAVARRLGVGRARMVTLDGELVEVSGAMIGGYRSRTNLSFREKELDVDLEKIESESEQLEKKIKLLENKKVEADEEIMNLRERKAVLEAEIIKLEKITAETESKKELGDKKTELVRRKKGLENDLKIVENDLARCEQDLQKLVKARDTWRSKLNGLTESFSKPLKELEDQKVRLQELLMENRSKISTKENQISLYEAERKRLMDIIAASDKDFDKFKQEMSDLKIKLKEKTKLLKDLQAKQKKFYAEYQGLFKKRERFDQQIRSIELQVIKFQERIRNMDQHANRVSVNLALKKGELEGLNKEFEEYEGVSLRKGLTLDNLNQEIRQFEKMLKNMGNVNLKALEVYEKVNESYKELLGKFEKLKLEKEDVLKMMYEIESKKRSIFLKTFKVIQKNFSRIYEQLNFKNNESMLILENEENPFEGGVEIKLKVGPKKFIDIKSLSGGEKTMVALAFIFALQEFEPAHFYLLDEVDAALDKRNSELLSHLIAEYAKKSQYIVISHNDSIISMADRIYGVSMQDDKSHVVSLKI